VRNVFCCSTRDSEIVDPVWLWRILLAGEFWRFLKTLPRGDRDTRYQFSFKIPSITPEFIPHVTWRASTPDWIRSTPTSLLFERIFFKNSFSPLFLFFPPPPPSCTLNSQFIFPRPSAPLPGPLSLNIPASVQIFPTAPVSTSPPSPVINDGPPFPFSRPAPFRQWNSLASNETQNLSSSPLPYSVAVAFRDFFPFSASRQDGFSSTPCSFYYTTFQVGLLLSPPPSIPVSPPRGQFSLSAGRRFLLFSSALKSNTFPLRAIRPGLSPCCSPGVVYLVFKRRLTRLVEGME